MKQLSLLLGVGLLFAGAFPVSAQQSEGGAMPRPVEHAELGLLEAVGQYSHRIVLALPGETSADRKAYQSYETNEETLVEGMGSIMQVNDELSEDVDHVVVVTYVDRGEHFLAKRINFAADDVIRETHGTIQDLNRDDRTMVVKNADGTERMDLGSGAGAVIDGNRGLLSISDLRVGQQVTVEYGTDGIAYLVRVE